MIKVGSLVRHIDPNFYGGYWVGEVKKVDGGIALVKWDHSFASEGLEHPISDLKRDLKATKAGKQ